MNENQMSRNTEQEWMVKKEGDRKPEFKERCAPLLASTIRGGAWGQIQGLPVTMQLLCFPWLAVTQQGEKDHPFCFQGLGESRMVPCSLHGGSAAQSDGQGGSKGKQLGPLLVVPQLSYPPYIPLPLVMLQPLCWVFKEGCKEPDNSPHQQSHTSLIFSPSNLVPCLKHCRFSLTWKFQETDWESLLERVLGEIR